MTTDPQPTFDGTFAVAVGSPNPGSAGDLCSFLTRQPEPPAPVLNEPTCYHIRAVDPGGFATNPATIAAVTIGHCSHN